MVTSKVHESSRLWVGTCADRESETRMRNIDIEIREAAVSGREPSYICRCILVRPFAVPDHIDPRLFSSRDRLAQETSSRDRLAQETSSRDRLAQVTSPREHLSQDAGSRDQLNRTPQLQGPTAPDHHPLTPHYNTTTPKTQQHNKQHKPTPETKSSRPPSNNTTL